MNSELQHWSEWVRSCEHNGDPYVLVTVLTARGSTPRGEGTKMLLAPDGAKGTNLLGTIGGGRLEYLAMAKARELLLAAEPSQCVENFPLGEKLGQCCGGSVTLLFESFVPTSFNVYLFGAGHVGRALAPILAQLPLRVHWVDSRADEFPSQIPSPLRQYLTDEPLAIVANAEPGSFFLVMTHEHPLDYALAEAVLRRADFAYLGVIGSQSKSRRFRQRLAHRGFDADEIAQLRCPIGLAEVPGKQPAEIAVAVAAEIVGVYQTLKQPRVQSGTSWKRLQQKLLDSDTQIDALDARNP